MTFLVCWGGGGSEGVEKERDKGREKGREKRRERDSRVKITRYMLSLIS